MHLFKVLLAALVIASQTAMILSAEQRPACTDEADKYHACVENHLALCEEGCPTEGAVSVAELDTEDLVCGVLNGMFCVVHYCCQRTCTRETMEYFECLAQEMKGCDLVCIDDDDASSGEMVGLSMLVLALVAVLSVTMHLYGL